VAKVKEALAQIGDIKPWRDDNLGCWVFEHPDFPESYGGETEQEVIERYPLYLANMFAADERGKLAPDVKKKIRWGGKREGAGRKVQDVESVQIRLPADIVAYIRENRQAAIDSIRTMLLCKSSGS
jgi:hypothetical protein